MAVVRAPDGKLQIVRPAGGDNQPAGMRRERIPDGLPPLFAQPGDPHAAWGSRRPETSNHAPASSRKVFTRYAGRIELYMALPSGLSSSAL